MRRMFVLFLNGAWNTLDINAYNPITNRLSNTAIDWHHACEPGAHRQGQSHLKYNHQGEIGGQWSIRS